jgi:hypothetical protein
LRGVWPEIRDRGAELVLIGNGGVRFARAFREDLGLEVPLYTDPSRETYRAAGMRREVGAVLHPRVLGGAVRAFAKGHRQGLVQGDAWQQGGVLVVFPPDQERFAHLNRSAEDHLDPQRILAALVPMT